MNKKNIFKMFFLDIVAAILLGISIDVFAINADFAPGRSYWPIGYSKLLI